MYEVNAYGSLCTVMYEILHPKAPEDELAFYLSYAERGMRILEPMCGSGRFFLPFAERGYAIWGVDQSEEMLARLRQKLPSAQAVRADFLEYDAEERFDYLLIPSGSVSLFTDSAVCKRVLKKCRELLAPGGSFVFSVDGVSDRCPEGEEISASVKTQEGLTLLLRSRHHYDPESQTQFSPGVYELYRGEVLLRSESMDFQTHLYRPGEMDQLLQEAGFSSIAVYSSFDKRPAGPEDRSMLLYACSV